MVIKILLTILILAVALIVWACVKVGSDYDDDDWRGCV